MKESDCSDLNDFLAGVSRAVSGAGSKNDTVAAVKELVTGALGKGGWLPERCLRTAPDGYARHLLFQDPDDRFEVVVMVWRQGQKTPVHDHGGVWCVEGVYTGRIKVTRYDVEPTAQPGVAALSVCEVIYAGTGETGALIPPVEHHAIENAFDTTAVTVHTYGGDLRACQVYLPRTDGGYDVCVKELCYTSRPEPALGGPSGRG